MRLRNRLWITFPKRNSTLVRLLSFFTIVGYNNARSVARKNMFGEKRGGANGARGRGRGNGRGNGRGGDRGNGRGRGQ